MSSREKQMKSLVRRLALVVGLVLGAMWAAPALAQETGFAAKRPLVGAACPNCPWGAVADVLKPMMLKRGWDLQICYNCSGVNSVRLVSGAQRPPERRPDQAWLPTPPNGPVDFGVTNLHRLRWAYEGTYDYAKEAPLRNLRLIARIEHPTYVGVAVRADSGITDLRQIRERRMPVKLIADDNPFIRPILEYYGIKEEDLKSWGGAIIDEGRTATRPETFDVLIHNQAYLSNTPESNIWYEATQRYDLRFLQLPDDLLDKLAKEFSLEKVDIPFGYMRGVDRRIRTVARSGQVVYGRTDMPDEFAFELAKAIDEDRRGMIWAPLPLSYNPQTGCEALGVPLHPGAERYCRSKGYIR
jgi:uncharacterized protein